MRSLRIFVLICMAMGLSSCAYDYLDDDELDLSPTVVPDQVSYLTDVDPILRRSCNFAGCHVSPGSPRRPAMDTYLELKEVVDNGRFQNAVFDRSPYPMPPSSNPQLTDVELSILRNWIDEGAQNN